MLYSTTAAIPLWNFDGSSTGQATGRNSDVFLRAVAVFDDPLRAVKDKSQHCSKLIMCETLNGNMKPHGLRVPSGPSHLQCRTVVRPSPR